MSFFYFFKHLHQVSFSDTRGLNLSPYSDLLVGPSWFTCSRISSIPSVQLELDEIWSNFLCCQVFPMGLPNSKNKNIELHNPSFIAWQFVFSQAIPMPYSLDPQVQLCSASPREFSDLAYFLAENDERKNLYSSFDFENSSFATPFFINWWLEHYRSQRQRISVCKEILVANLPDFFCWRR